MSFEFIQLFSTTPRLDEDTVNSDEFAVSLPEALHIWKKSEVVDAP
jgi:hypothetical protein